jgi:spore coat polysaccharide biosynthesis predicted glycosyltransferase SpsG
MVDEKKQEDKKPEVVKRDRQDKYICLGCSDFKRLVCKLNKLYIDCAAYNMPESHILKESFIKSKNRIGDKCRKIISKIPVRL